MQKPTEGGRTQQVLSLGLYVVAYVVLLVLLGASYATSRTDVGGMAYTIRLIIAFLQLAIVVFVFMHLRMAKGSIPYFAAAVIVFVVLLFTIPLVDLETRFPPARPFENMQGPSPTLYPSDPPD